MSTWAELEARRIQKACILLRRGVEGTGGAWADLGCGSGIFTAALVSLLRPGSEIYAVDKHRRALDAVVRNLSDGYEDALLHPVLADFTRPLGLPQLDGILMANSLHFVKRKEPVLVRLVRLLKPGGRLVVVEYNTSRGNYAVPHPMNEAGFIDLAKRAGLDQVCVLAKIPSTFLGEMYAGMGLTESGR